MDGKNVTELTEISNLNDDDAMLVGQSNSLKRISFANVKTLFWTIINVVSNLATSAKNGLMAAVDKAKLDAMSDTLKNKTVSDSVVDNSDIIVSGKAVNGALADLVHYNISTATSLDNAIPTVSQKYKKCRFKGTVNSIDGIWLIETYNTQHDSNNNLYLYTQFAYQLKADTVIGSKFIRQGYSSDKGVTNTWATWEYFATSSDLANYDKKYVIKSGTLTIATVKRALGTDGFYFYKSNKADWTRFVSGIYQNGNIVNKQGTWKAELSSDGTTIQGNDNNDTWNCIPIALSL